MAWSGYFRYGDTEIINASRVSAYAESLGLTWVKETGEDSSLPALLGSTGYTHPVLDPAPWYDPDDPASADFAGLIPLSVEGIENSTRSSNVFEFTSDGGNPGSIRNSTKTVVFSAALVGVNECAVEYGFRWLKRALLRRNCQPGGVTSCRGERLYYAKCMPEGFEGGNFEIYDGGFADEDTLDVLDGGSPSAPGVDVVDGGTPFDAIVPDVASEEWTRDYERHLSSVLFNAGPVVNSKKTLPGCNGVIWMVSFTAVAGNPFEYGNPLPVLDGLGDGTNPFIAPYAGLYGTDTYTGAPCVTPTYQPLYDPSFPALTTPPAPPNIAPAGWLGVSGGWTRSYADLPASVVPEWDEVRPIITVRSSVDWRMVRVRFYPSYADPDADCDDLVGEYIISYIPEDVDFIINTAEQAVYVYDPATEITRRADSLVYGTWDARPINWFGLSCGGSYRVTVDFKDPVLGPDPVLDMDLSLVPRAA